MGTGNKDVLRFLQQQREWSKEQLLLLDEMEEKLFEMKKIALYAVEHDLSTEEAEKLNKELNLIKMVVFNLEQKLHRIVH